MRIMPHKIISVLLAVAAAQCSAQNSGPVDRLLDQIARQERSFLQRLRTYSPVVETYLQELSEGGDAPSAADHYFLGKADFSKGIGIGYSSFVARTKAQKHFLTFLQKGKSTAFTPEGFAQMLLIDSENFDRVHYQFTYVRREFLGEIRCLVFDVAPVDKKAAGRFVGRIWVDDVDDRIVRFNGTYTESRPSRLYFHFDSWRANIAPGIWLPAYVYIEETGGAGGEAGFKGQTRIWGYKPAGNEKIEELTSVLVDRESGVKDRTAVQDVSPLESQRAWERQAEENIIERLERTGLLAPKGDVDAVLDTVVNNLLATTNIDADVQCRVLLTTPLETFSVGRTIIVSRGLIDVLPDEASLAMVLANELAQIALGYTTQTKFAFQDENMFADEDTLRRFRFARREEEISKAGAKASEILSNSPYKEKLGGALLFLRALNARAPRLSNLIQANLGNQLGSGRNLERIANMAGKAPGPNQEPLNQIAALPLGSRVKMDPYSARIALVKAKPVPLLSPREKLPFEVTPFMPYLVRAESEDQKSGAALSAAP